MTRMNEIPEGWSSVKLGDIFTEEQLNHVAKVCEDSKGDMMKASKELRPYFQGIRAQLEAKGLLPEYAAYAIPYFLMNGREA